MLNSVVQEVTKKVPIEVVKLKSKLAVIQSENAKINRQIKGLKVQKIVWKNHLDGSDLYLKNKAQNEIKLIDLEIKKISSSLRPTRLLIDEINATQFVGTVLFSAQLNVISSL